MKYIPIILGTAREGRYSEYVSNFVFKIAQEIPDVESKIIDPREFLIKQETIAPWMNKEETKKWQSEAQRADAFIIVTPEYNHGYPGELKMLLDSAFKEYFGKPVSIVGVSKGGFAGTRVIENLLPVLLALGTHPILPSVNVSKIQEWVDDKKMEGFSNEYSEKIQNMVERLLEFR